MLQKEGAKDFEAIAMADVDPWCRGYGDAFMGEVTEVGGEAEVLGGIGGV